MADNGHVHIVDDDAGVRRSVAFLLQTNGFTVSTWSSATLFLADLREVASGCILLDVGMPELDGLTCQATLRERGVNMPVVMLTGHGDISTAIRAMKAGAVDFLEKPVDRATLLDALSRAMAVLNGTIAKSSQAHHARLAIARLTDRERDVLGGLAKGLSNKGIAIALDISARTVEVHRANIMSKLGTASLSDTLRIAFAAE